MQNLTCNASECSESRERPVVVWILWLIFFTTRESLSSSQALIDKQLERKKDYANFYDYLLDGGGGGGGDLLMEGRLITDLPAAQYPNVRVIMKYRLVSFLTKSVLERHLVLWISRTTCIFSIGEPRTETNNKGIQVVLHAETLFSPNIFGTKSQEECLSEREGG